MAHILFVLHEASRTGAPFTQLHLMRWVKKNTSHTMSLLLMWGGDLVPEFEELGRVYVLDHGKPAVSLKERALARWDRMTAYRRKGIYRAIQQQNPQVIFANSAVSLHDAVEVKRVLGVKLAINLHELDHTFFHYSKEQFAQTALSVDFFVPGSYAVKDFFQSFCVLPEEKVQVVYDFINDQPLGTSTAATVRQQHGIPEHAQVVCAIGSLISRKGPDLFLEVARKVLPQHPEAYFVWVGGKLDSRHYKEIARDIRLMGLDGRILFVGEQRDLRGYYELLDVFLLTSREDPFPLVCLEASLAGKPVICFDRAGGMPEFARNDAGFVVPYLDTDAMAEKTLTLLQDPAQARAKGLQARQRVQDNHTIRTIGPAMYEIISQLLPANAQS